MTQFEIQRERTIRNTNNEVVEVFTKPVARFSSAEEALDELCRQARRHGYKVTIDNDLNGFFGFCLWQIQVVVGQWTYRVVEFCDDLCDFYEIDEYGWPETTLKGEHSFEVTLNVKDINTQIQLPDYTCVVKARGYGLAGRKAKADYLSRAKGVWAEDKMAKYGLTAKQFDMMLGDGLIAFPDLYEVTVKDCIIDCPEEDDIPVRDDAWHHPYVQEILADSCY